MNDVSKMLSINATLSQNMDFIKAEHATVYLSSILDFHCSGFLQNTGWFVTNILGQQIGSTFKGQDVQKKKKKVFLLGHIYLLDIMSWNVSDKPTYIMWQPRSPKISYSGRSLKSGIN